MGPFLVLVLILSCVAPTTFGQSIPDDSIHSDLEVESDLDDVESNDGHWHNKNPPNFILILADDLGYADLGITGSSTIRTPHLDRLFTEGMRFSQFYAYPLCSPSRAAMLTGRYAVRNGVYTNFTYPQDAKFRIFFPTSAGCLLKNETTIPQFLKQHKSANYFTSMIGKWHLGHQSDIGCLPTLRGFDEFFGLPYSHEEGWPVPIAGDLAPGVPVYEGTKIIEQPVNLQTLTGRYNTRISQLLDQMAKKKRPFFLHYAPEQPHFPVFASPEFVNKSLRGSYGDAVQELDASVGLIMDKLRKTGLDKNTLVFFASDNGGWLNPGIGLPGYPTYPLDGGSNGALFDGKGSTYEGGDRVVAAFWWPKNVLPQINPAVASMHDILPTILELTGIKKPQDLVLDGFSLVPLLTGKNKTSPTTFYYYYREPLIYAVRYGPWKCHYITRSGFEADPPVVHDPCILYQIEWNPSETIPLNSSLYPNVIATLNQAKLNQELTVFKGPPQYNAQYTPYTPCCNGVVTDAKIAEGKALGLTSAQLWPWMGCVCGYQSNDESQVLYQE